MSEFKNQVTEAIAQRKSIEVSMLTATDQKEQIELAR